MTFTSHWEWGRGGHSKGTFQGLVGFGPLVGSPTVSLRQRGRHRKGCTHGFLGLHEKDGPFSH